MNCLIVPKILKKGTLWDFLTFVLLQNIKKIERRTLWGHLKNFEKKVSQSRKKSHKAEKSHSAEKSQNLLLRNTCKKLAHTHGFEHETSGLKSKQLTTRPRTRETCELPREIRELSRGKQSTRTFP